MERVAYIFRDVVDKVGLDTVKDLIKQPGMRGVHRITLHYHDFRARDTIATITRGIDNTAQLAVIYYGRFEHKPLKRTLSPTDYERFNQVFQNIKFDKMIDQQKVSPYGVDLCMVERATGGFVKSIIFAPEKAEDHYATLYNVISAYLPEVIRQVK